MNSLIFHESDLFTASFSDSPTTPFQIDILLPIAPTQLSQGIFIDTFVSIQHLSHVLQTALNVPRYGLITHDDTLISLIPLHGISSTWEPMIAGLKTTYDTFPGYITTNDAPEVPAEVLERVKDAIRSSTGLKDSTVLKSCIGSHDETNLFARLIREEIPVYKYFDSPSHVASLTPFPNTPGYSCVVPKRHYPSDILRMPEEAYRELMAITWEVVQHVKTGLNVRACGIVFEGYEINWVHVKLIPIREKAADVGPGDGKKEERVVFFENYPGYLTTQKGPTMTSDERKRAEVVAESLRSGSQFLSLKHAQHQEGNE